MDCRTGEWMEAWTHERPDEWINRWLGGWMNGWVDGWINVNKWIAEWMDVQMDHWSLGTRALTSAVAFPFLACVRASPQDGEHPGRTGHDTVDVRMLSGVEAEP